MNLSPQSFIRLLLISTLAGMMLVGFDCETNDPCNGPDACMESNAALCFSIGSDQNCPCQCRGGRVELQVYDQFNTLIKDVQFGAWSPYDQPRKSYCTINNLPACENLTAIIYVFCDLNCSVVYRADVLHFRVGCNQTYQASSVLLKCKFTI